jgi:hypothetical protein
MIDYRERCLDERISCCWVCGSTDELEVHHINGDRSDNDLSNLLPLCEDCHSEVHYEKVGASDERIENLKERLPANKVTHHGGEWRPINFPLDMWEYVVNTKGTEQSFSDRVREIMDTGIDAEEQADE